VVTLARRSGSPAGHVQDALRADGVEEPRNEGTGQAVPCVDSQARVVDEDWLAKQREGVGGLAGRDGGDVEGLDLGQLCPGRGDLDPEHGAVLGSLAGVPGDEADTVEHQ
jgi:hypothetical protein